MSSRALALATALALVAPGRPLADDDWGYGSSGGYDVSVDLNVQGGVTVDAFDAPLAPYGEWVVAGGYGRVWRPHVAPGWRPYYYGRWEWTNEGWFWASDEPWGWAAYHYGRWAYDPYYGWLWVPGTEWAPAWVAWRSSGEVVGWAPLAPGFSVYAGSYPYVDLWWTFVPCGRFVSVPAYQAAYPPAHGRRWFDATAPAPARPPRGGPAGAGPAPAWGGPAPRMIEGRIGRPVTPVRVVRAPSPGAGHVRPGEVAVFRPERPGRDDGHARPWRDERGGPAPAGAPRAPGAAPAPAPGWSGRGDGGDHRGGGLPPQGGAPRGGATAPPAGWSGDHPQAGRGWRGPAAPAAPAPAGPGAGRGSGPAPQGFFPRGGGSHGAGPQPGAHPPAPQGAPQGGAPQGGAPRGGGHRPER